MPNDNPLKALPGRQSKSKLDSIRDARRRHGRSRVILLIAILFIVASALIAYYLVANLNRLEVGVSPEKVAKHAQITLIDGFGIVHNSAIYSLGRAAKIRVAADGYESQEIEITPAAWDRGKLDVILRELLAVIRATSVPGLDDTLWYLNNALIAQGGTMQRKVEPGTYMLAARNPYYAEANSEIAAKAGQEYDLEFNLTPIQGVLTVTSKPSGANVTVNTVSAGRTPIDVKLQGGKHKLLVSLDNHDSRSEVVAISAGAEQVTRHYELAPTQVPISFSFSPSGGQIVLNGHAAPNLATSQAMFNIGTTHRVRYSKPGYAAKEIEFTASAENRSPVTVKLEPEFGIVDIRSEPANVDIEISGSHVGSTPLRLKLHAVEQTIVLNSPGFVTETLTVVPDSNEPKKVLISLVREKEHRLATSPQAYVNSAGIELKMFNGAGAFIMGTRRGQAGRRANEFVREVRLAKPFYAGINEVTVEQYQKFADPSAPAAGNRTPAVNVEWIDAARFCNWLSDTEGFDRVYLFSGSQFLGSNPAADGYRLLTEPEWEWLARKSGRERETRYSWGDSSDPKDFAGNLGDVSARGAIPFIFADYEDGFARSSPAGSFPANRGGIHDLSGNVSEWIHDSYNLQPPRSGSVEVDPFDTGTTSRRTIKGSNWKTGRANELRAAWREGGISAKDTVGFRVARYLYRENQT